MTISEAFSSLTDNIRQQKAKVKVQISDYEAKLANARKLIIEGKIEEDDFRELKSEYIEGINKLEKELIILQADAANIDVLLNQGIENLLKLDEALQKGELL